MTDRKVWYRQIHPTSWVAYRGNQGIWEETSEGCLLTWLRSQGITEAEYHPLRISRVV